MGMHLAMFNVLNCILHFINENVAKLREFDTEKFKNTFWYRWETFSQFRLVYFVIGIVGSLALKFLFDKCLKLIRKGKT